MFETSYLSETRNYWFIRSGQNGGEFYKHFRDNSLIAIGHSDATPFSFESGQELTPADKLNIIDAVKRNMREKRRSPSEVGNISGQLNRFLNEMKVDDIVITVNSNDQIVAGKVISECFYSDEAIEPNGYDPELTPDMYPCHYTLRVHIKWGKQMQRSMIPFPVEKTLRTPLTVAYLDKPEQVSALNHWLFPLHITANQVRCTLKITTVDQIHNRQLTKLSQALDELELLSGYLTSLSDIKDLNVDSYVKFANINQDNFAYSLTAQHLFMSPGYQFLQFPVNRRTTTIFAAIFFYIFSPEAVSVESIVPDGISVNDFVTLADTFKDKVQLDTLRDILDIELPKSNLSPSNDSSNSTPIGSNSDGFEDSEALDDNML